MNTDKADILVVEKKPGETMGQLITRVRSSLEIPLDIKMTFAGRLDPLAGGLILLLRGEKRYEKDAFLALTKTYSFDIIFDVKTDTLDVLGKITDIQKKNNTHQLKKTEGLLRKILPGFEGKHTQSYPRYSSKTVKGIPLFEYARKNIPVNIPTKNIEISSILLKGVSEIDRDTFMLSTKKEILSVSGDFRQGEIRALWNKNEKNLPEKVQVAHVVVECSSGTYVRVLAEKIASKIGRIGIASNITRTRVGGFTKNEVVV